MRLLPKRKNYSYQQKITMVAMLLALMILFQFLEKFMPFGFGYVNFNFSLLFIILLNVLLGWHWALILLVIRLLLGPVLSAKGYGLPSEVIGQIDLFVIGGLAVLFFNIFEMIFKRLKLGWRHLYTIIGTMVSTSIFAAGLNALFFVPWYFAVYPTQTWTLPLSVHEASSLYETNNWKVFYFWIPNYWTGILSVYFTFNIINLAIIFALYWPISRILPHFNGLTHIRW